jgi:predicted GIY-YIG superfamily endonuclease
MAVNEFTVYKITTKSCHSYIGCTGDLKEREGFHKWNLKRGYLGKQKVPKSTDYILEVIATARILSDAQIIESRFIALDILANPLRNCNIRIGICNPF